MRGAIIAAMIIAPPAFAADPGHMIEQCDAPMATAIAVAAGADANSAEWSNLNLAILAHRRNCALAMALTCHFDAAPQECFAATIAALDAHAEAERRKLDEYAEAGGVMFGELPRERARTTPARQAERDAYCRQNSGDTAAYIGVLGGDVTAACHLEIAVSQWATLSFSGAAPKALSLLPPAAD